MADDNTAVLTLLTIWDGLPSLTGDQWVSLEQQLKKLLEEFEGTADSTTRYRISLDIQNTLETVPAAIDRFDTVFAEIDVVSPNKTRGILDIMDILGCAGRFNRAKTFTRYTDISYPQQVWVKEQRISVIVRLTLQPSIYDRLLESILVQSHQPVLVHIEAAGFDTLSAIEQETPVLHKADSPPLIFDLKPQQIGRTSIILDFFQIGNPIGTVSLPVEITAEQTGQSGETIAGPVLRSAEEVDAPDFMLYISYEQFFNPPTLSFELRTAHDPGQTFTKFTLPIPPEKYAEQLYRQLTVLIDRVDPTTHDVLGQVRVIDPIEAEDQLTKLGKLMWRDLIPHELKARYEREREQWRDRSLLIVSDEPHIPWELLWPYGAWGDEGPLCLRMRLARWLRRSSQGRATSPPEPSLSINELAIIAPADSGLLGAQRERVFLTSLINQHGLTDVSPPEPTCLQVKRLLEQGSYTWFHVAAHGNFYPDNPDGESAIWLKDGQPLTPNAIIGNAEAYLSEHRPAFVFNACEVGRQGWAITGIGGWAERLISAGAGLFLAPQWVVNDVSALQFCKAVYRVLLNGHAIAEAVRQARQAARRAGDPSWLAYTLYAHPNARLVGLEESE